MTGGADAAWDGLVRLHQRLLRRGPAEADGTALQPPSAPRPAGLHPSYVALEDYRPVELDGVLVVDEAVHLDALPRTQSDAALLAIIAAEGPVHDNVLTARLLEQVAQSRSSARLRGTIHESLTALAAAGRIVREDDFSALGAQLQAPPYRDWRTQTERLRRLDHVHDRELMLALLRAVDDQEGMGGEDVMNHGLHRIGFIRLTTNARARLCAPLDALLAAGLLEARGDGLWLGRYAFLR